MEWIPCNVQQRLTGNLSATKLVWLWQAPMRNPYSPYLDYLASINGPLSIMAFHVLVVDSAYVDLAELKRDAPLNEVWSTCKRKTHMRVSTSILPGVRKLQLLARVCKHRRSSSNSLTEANGHIRNDRPRLHAGQRQRGRAAAKARYDRLVLEVGYCSHLGVVTLAVVTQMAESFVSFPRSRVAAFPPSQSHPHLCFIQRYNGRGYMLV